MPTPNEVLRKLYALAPPLVKPGLGRERALLKALGNPERAYPSILVAGTNGKGSTSAFAHSILSAAGLDTGLYTSPHLIAFNERIKVKDALIKGSEIVRLASRISRKAPKGTTFFEFTTAMAFEYFREKGVDAAVVEVGMGGRLDATNVITPGVSIITGVGMDHMKELGNTISKIAAEKAGIIKKNSNVVTAAAGAALKVIEKAAKEKNARVFVCGRDFSVTRSGRALKYESRDRVIKGLRLALFGAHQLRNAACAIKAVELMEDYIGCVCDDAVREGLVSAAWPGRFETFGTRPRVVVDAAHNTDGALALKNALKDAGIVKPVLVLGIMADKDIDGILKALIPLARKVVVTRPDMARSASLDELAARAGKFGIEAIREGRVSRALEKARKEAGPSGVVCVSGSVFTAAEAIRFLRRRKRY
ncbi:MAG: bifunctional folylpolyglutamate synthase/dihydrofolate synthase [Deltaproteobacteria bacterium]|nr:bifunctional folylpolyglutamate synthase/dihydrofolate synthase [Deltaproteobacteria bacterium]